MAYVSEQNLLNDAESGPVHHPGNRHTVRRPAGRGVSTLRHPQLTLNDPAPGARDRIDRDRVFVADSTRHRR